MRASLVAQLAKNAPAMQETPVRFLGWEDPLEEGMATHSNILAWRIPMDRGAWQGTVHGSQRVGQSKQLTLSLSFPTGLPTSFFFFCFLFCSIAE